MVLKQNVSQKNMHICTNNSYFKLGKVLKRLFQICTKKYAAYMTIKCQLGTKPSLPRSAPIHFMSADGCIGVAM